MKRLATWVPAAMLIAAAACGSGDGGAADAATDVAPEGADMEPGPDGQSETQGDAAADEGSEVSPETVADVTEEPQDVPADTPAELPPLPLKPPLPTPADPLASTGIESCPVYLAERCEAGVRQVCAIYDTAAHAFTDAPDPLLERVYLFERWQDLYQTADGQTGERRFNAPTPPGTPEEQWGAPERFAGWDGMGDSGIWTGWTVVGDILRYSQTGTEADYRRMEDGVRTLLAMYDVTGVPGYFIRNFYLLMPEGAPNVPEHNLRFEDQVGTLNHHHRPVDVAALDRLPAVYRDGITDASGKVWKGKPMWQGRPSIDQNTGPMNALSLAWHLIRDQSLKERIAHHLTCYLKRLQRIEIVNLQQNKPVLDTLVQFLNSGDVKLDPGDIDLTKTDRIVAYVQRQINTANEATFDRSCPTGVQRVPWRVLDASSQTFLGEFLLLVQDMDTSAGGENQIDHYYFPTVRGGDAIHLIHLAVMAYEFTGDDEYRRFLFEDVLGDMRGLDVVDIAGAFDQPKFCSHFFGDQLTYGSWWVLLGMLQDSELKTRLQKAFHEEMYQKLLKAKGNVDFYLMYAGEVPPSIGGPERDAALSYALAELPTMGGNGFVNGTPLLDDPRRSYTLAPQFVMEHAPGEIEAVCPTQKEYELCTTEIEFMGIKIPGQNLIHDRECGEPGPWECKLPNGRCTDKMTDLPLPVGLRQYTDWLWQRNPYELVKGVAVEGGVQMPGADLSEPYWNARRYGFITAGAGQVLAWKDSGSCEPEPATLPPLRWRPE